MSKKVFAKNCVAYAVFAYTHLVMLAFWGSITAGYFYYGFIGEGDWGCHAT